MAEPLYSGKDPFPRWLRRLFPDLNRLDQNPVFAACYDFRVRKVVRVGRKKRLLQIAVLAGLALVIYSFASYSSFLSALFWGAFIYLLWWLGGGDVPNSTEELFIDVPVSPRDLLDTVLGLRALELARSLLLMVAVSAFVALALIIIVPGGVWMKWPFVIVVPWLLLAITKMEIWSNASGACLSLASTTIAGIGKYAGDRRFSYRQLNKVAWRIYPVSAAIAAAAITIGVLAFVDANLSASAFLFLAAAFCTWQTFYSRGRAKASICYRRAEMALREALPISTRVRAGDEIEPHELTRLLELYRMLGPRKFRIHRALNR